MNDRIRAWDERFARGEELHDFEPSPPLPSAVAGVAPGLALDLASGAGRHALWLAERGWQVHAVDGSRVGTERMMTEAGRRGIAARIEPRIADLEAPGFTIEADRYDLVCDFYFLHRPLFEEIRRAVRPGGLFVAAIHTKGGTSEGHFVLHPGELRTMVEGWGWTIVKFREGDAPESGHRHPTAELVARRTVS
ncbi:MAG TPA: methyltransferase domain-containing protein [Myxococcales bacterium]|nr:methyltransferase domain-containing protein [Myxococcales bacterium]